MEECSHIADVQSKVPFSRYNSFLNESKNLTCSPEGLTKIETFFNSIIEIIMASEALGQYVVTNQQKNFPKVNNRYY